MLRRWQLCHALPASLLNVVCSHMSLCRPICTKITSAAPALTWGLSNVSMVCHSDALAAAGCTAANASCSCSHAMHAAAAAVSASFLLRPWPWKLISCRPEWGRRADAGSAGRGGSAGSVSVQVKPGAAAACCGPGGAAVGAGDTTYLGAWPLDRDTKVLSAAFGLASDCICVWHARTECVNNQSHQPGPTTHGPTSVPALKLIGEQALREL